MEIIGVVFCELGKLVVGITVGDVSRIDDDCAAKELDGSDVDTALDPGEELALGPVVGNDTTVADSAVQLDKKADDDPALGLDDITVVRIAVEVVLSDIGSAVEVLSKMEVGTEKSEEDAKDESDAVDKLAKAGVDASLENVESRDVAGTELE